MSAAAPAPTVGGPSAAPPADGTMPSAVAPPAGVGMPPAGGPGIGADSAVNSASAGGSGGPGGPGGPASVASGPAGSTSSGSAGGPSDSSSGGPGGPGGPGGAGGSDPFGSASGSSAAAPAASSSGAASPYGMGSTSGPGGPGGPGDAGGAHSVGLPGASASAGSVGLPGASASASASGAATTPAVATGVPSSSLDSTSMSDLAQSGINSTSTVTPDGANKTTNATFYPQGVTCSAYFGKGEFTESFLDFGLGFCGNLTSGNASEIIGWMGTDVNGTVVAYDHATVSNTTFVLFSPDTNMGTANCTTAVNSIITACMPGDTSERMFTTGLFDYSSETTSYAESYMFGWVNGLDAKGIKQIADDTVKAKEKQEADQKKLQEDLDKLIKEKEEKEAARQKAIDEYTAKNRVNRLKKIAEANRKKKAQDALDRLTGHDDPLSAVFDRRDSTTDDSTGPIPGDAAARPSRRSSISN